MVYVRVAKRQSAKTQNRNNRPLPGGKQNKFGARGGKAGFRKRDRRQDRNPSLAVEADWELVYELNLADLGKLQANPPTTNDLYTCGHVDQFDDSYERLTVRTASRLRRSENKLFYYVTSKEDPILEKYAIEGEGNIFATDAILAQLMAAPRSVYSWDIVAQKINGMVFLDKREDSSFDLLTVSETAQDPPGHGDDVEEFNHPEKLSLEATLINQNFSQQVLVEPSEDAPSRKSVSVFSYCRFLPSDASHNFIICEYSSNPILSTTTAKEAALSLHLSRTPIVSLPWDPCRLSPGANFTVGWVSMVRKRFARRTR